MSGEMTFSEKIMRCPACSAPMYREEEREYYYCVSCRKEIPVSAAYMEMFVPEGHSAPTLKGDEIHFSGLTPQKSIRPSRESLKASYELRTSSPLRLFREKAGKSAVTFTCPYCQETVSGRIDHDTLIRCGSCKRKYSPEEALFLPNFSQRLTPEEGEIFPKRCLPFEVTMNEAMHLIREMVHRHRSESPFLRNDHMIDELVPQPFFVPCMLADLRTVAKCRTGLKSYSYFLDLVNWPFAVNHSLDIFLLDHIARWDYDDLVPFHPDRIRKANVLPQKSIFRTDDLVRLMLRERVNSAFRKAYDGLSLDHLGESSWELRFPRRDLIALPIYYAQIALPIKEIFIRIAINGQNGLSALVIRRGIHFRTLHYDSYNIHPYGEATMNSIPVPVREIAKNESYRVIRRSDDPNASTLDQLLEKRIPSADMDSEPWKKVL